jgi:hypothetical protein
MLLQGCSGLTPASFPLPDNPILRAFSPRTLMGMGDFFPASFPLPDNPILRASGLCGCGSPLCGCPGGLCSGGMGDIGTSLSNAWSGLTTGGYNNYLMLGGAAILGLMMFTGTKKHRERSASRAEYKAAVGQARAKYRRAQAA